MDKQVPRRARSLGLAIAAVALLALALAGTASAAVGDFQTLADSPVRLTSFTVDPTTNLLYGQQNQGTGYYRYDPRTDAWTPLANAPLSSGNNGGAAYLDGKIYTAYTGNSSSLGVYDIASDSWTTIANPLGQGTGNITAYQGNLYLVYDQSFVRYTPATDTTTTLANAPVFSSDPNCTDPATSTSPGFGFDRWGGLQGYKGKIYGHQGDGYCGFGVYDIASDSWTELAPVPDDITGSEGTDNAALLGSAFDPVTASYYTLGGYGENHLFSYKTAGTTWDHVDMTSGGAPFNVDDSGMAYVTLPGLRGLYIIEGESGTGFIRYVTVDPPDLAVTAATDKSDATVGDTITYTVTVKNNGGLAPNVVVTDTPPSNATVESVTASQGSCTGTSCSLGDLAAGATATVTVVVKASSAGTATNSASAASDRTDANDADTSASASTTVAQPAAGAAPANGAAPAKPKAPVRCVVPNLRNRSVTSARRALAHAHCRLGSVTTRKGSSRRTGTVHVLSQSVRAGTRTKAGSRVAVTVGRTGPLRQRRVSPSFTG